MSPVGGATHQLLVADRQVGDFPPAHRHHVEAAVRLPAKDPQRVCGPAVQTAAIRAEKYTPEPTGGGDRVQRSYSSNMLSNLLNTVARTLT